MYVGFYYILGMRSEPRLSVAVLGSGGRITDRAYDFCSEDHHQHKCIMPGHLVQELDVGTVEMGVFYGALFRSLIVPHW